MKDGCTGGHRHRRTGPGGSGGDRRLQSLYRIRRHPLLQEQFGIPYEQLELEILQAKRDASDQVVIDVATQEARGGLTGSVMISDAFFPFRDGVDVGIRQGITVVAHAGGSVRDYEVIEACNEAEPPVAMVFTGQRCFKH